MLLAAACLVPQTMALELTDLHLPLTRAEADESLSKDYHFRVLADMTVRRSWVLGNRTVSVDFSPKEGDQALLIFIDYKIPASPDEAHQDARALCGEDPGAWRRLLPQRAARLGMREADGLKLDGGRYCFRERNAQGKIVRLAYYAGIPGDPRWHLADDDRQDGKTAMGTRSTAGTASFLWRDEERRQGQVAEAAAPTAAAPEVAAEQTPPAAADGAATPARAKMLERPEEAPDIVAAATDFVNGLTPIHYALGGGVLALLVLMRVVASYRESRRRAMVAEYIINGGRAPKGENRR